MPTSRPNDKSICKRDRSAGFTLVEVVLAMSIMAMLVAIGLPFVRPHVGMSALRAKAFEIAVLLRSDRNAALRSGMPLSITVDLPQQRIVSSRDGAEVLLPTAIALHIQPRDLRQIEFLPDGHASAARLLLVSGGRTVAVDTNSLSGSVDILDVAK